MSELWAPRPFQAKGVELCISQACAGLLMDPGLGKTSVMYAVIQILKDHGLLSKVLVICPVRPAYQVWPKQKDKYSQFEGLRVTVLHGKDKEANLQDPGYDIYVVNPEGLPWLLNASVEIKKRMIKGEVREVKTLVIDPVRLKFLKNKFSMLVVDESGKFRQTTSQRFKLLKYLIPSFKRRYIMNGTIIPKSLEDLFGQIFILDEGLSLGANITQYRKKYFYPAGWGGYSWLPKDGAMEAVGARIAPLVLRVGAKGNIALPALVIDDRWIDLDPVARKIYGKMLDELIVQIAENKVIAANAAVASSKCRQIANGAIYRNDGSWAAVHDEKLQALTDLLEELQGTPLLITYEFEFDRERIAEKLNIPCISTGNVARDTQNIERFRRGELVAVMGHPQSISLGIDGLQDSCNHLAMYGVTWNLQDYKQVIDRIRRQGNRADTVVLHRILAKATVDERVLEVLDQRDATQEGFLNLLQSLREFNS